MSFWRSNHHRQHHHTNNTNNNNDDQVALDEEDHHQLACIERESQEAKARKESGDKEYEIFWLTLHTAHIHLIHVSGLFSFFLPVHAISFALTRTLIYYF